MKTKGRRARKTLYSHQPQYTHGRRSHSSFENKRNYMHGNSSIGDRQYGDRYDHFLPDEIPQDFDEDSHSNVSNMNHPDNSSNRDMHSRIDEFGRSDWPAGAYNRKNDGPHQNTSEWAFGRSWDRGPADWIRRSHDAYDARESTLRQYHGDGRPTRRFLGERDQENYEYPPFVHNPVERHHYGKGPKGYQRADSRILEDVCDQLTNDYWIDASGIAVEVKKGEVLLKGTVSDKYQKRGTEDLAEGISGVTHVENRIRIKAQQEKDHDGRNPNNGSN